MTSTVALLAVTIMFFTTALPCGLFGVSCWGVDCVCVSVNQFCGLCANRSISEVCWLGVTHMKDTHIHVNTYRYIHTHTSIHTHIQIKHTNLPTHLLDIDNHIIRLGLLGGGPRDSYALELPLCLHVGGGREGWVGRRLCWDAFVFVGCFGGLEWLVGWLVWGHGGLSGGGLCLVIVCG
jgi:hypothetical protein